MNRRNSVPIVRMYDVRSVSNWLESLGQCPRSIAEDIASGGEYFIAFSQGKPAVFGWCQTSDCTIYMTVDRAFLGQGIASLMHDFLEEKLVIALSRQAVQFV